jgi:hypothetical protein
MIRRIIKGNSPMWRYMRGSIGSPPPSGYGESFPAPSMDYNLQEQQLVMSSRNASGQVISDKINRRLLKHNNIRFPVMDYNTAYRFRDYVEGFYIWVTYWDLYLNRVNRRLFYFGDFEMTPWGWDFSHTPVAKPLSFKDIKCNLIDMGYEDF